MVAILIGTLGAAAASEIEGSWHIKNQEGIEAIFISFSADGSFYIDSQPHWYIGSYELAANDETSHLILEVEDGSSSERAGERFTYSYELDTETLIVDISENPGILESQGANGRAFFIAINYDSDEDDDDDEEFSLYASCFVQAANTK